MELDRMVQTGTVTDTDGKRYRVRFAETGITSGWLGVIQNGTGWAPAVGQRVLVLYQAGYNAEGFILGGV